MIANGTAREWRAGGHNEVTIVSAPASRSEEEFPQPLLLRLSGFSPIACQSTLHEMSTECSRIAYALASAINGEAWYGNSLREILKSVTAEQAQRHPLPNAHSVWELLRHVDAWAKFALGAVQGTPIPPWPAMPVELDWPTVPDPSEPAWKLAMDEFFEHHLKLVDVIGAFNDERLEATVPGRSYNFYRLFQSATQHAIYHAGQIALLKKMLQ